MKIFNEKKLLFKNDDECLINENLLKQYYNQALELAPSLGISSNIPSHRRIKLPTCNVKKENVINFDEIVSNKLIQHFHNLTQKRRDELLEERKLLYEELDYLINLKINSRCKWKKDKAEKVKNSACRKSFNPKSDEQLNDVLPPILSSKEDVRMEKIEKVEMNVEELEQKRKSELEKEEEKVLKLKNSLENLQRKSFQQLLKLITSHKYSRFLEEENINNLHLMNNRKIESFSQMKIDLQTENMTMGKFILRIFKIYSNSFMVTTDNQSRQYFEECFTHGMKCIKEYINSSKFSKKENIEVYMKIIDLKRSSSSMNEIDDDIDGKGNDVNIETTFNFEDTKRMKVENIQREMIDESDENISSKDNLSALGTSSQELTKSERDSKMKSSPSSSNTRRNRFSGRNKKIVKQKVHASKGGRSSNRNSRKPMVSLTKKEQKQFV
ncbi:hypothetical protein SNEBB_002794 [Seison nebaliae]|nr:hypothetical protein SNEBB_002794 [Seison nebaliae]